ncbi:MAG: hypothetical protein CL928_16855 [Deltaproteobacteria bacterium]|nr:hypothetical protein [Deltaproteobacteria bacterium]
MVLRRYVRWLHTGWPAGTPERLPVVGELGRTSVPGLRVVGDLCGVPLLKFAVDSGAAAIQAIISEPEFVDRRGEEGVLDVAVVGGGVAGISAAIAAREAGLDCKVYEAAQSFATIHNFPRRKPIFTYPSDMEPRGSFQVTAERREELLVELEEQRRQAEILPVCLRIDHVERRDGLLYLIPAGDEEPVPALRVVVAIGRTGNFRALGVPGEELAHVTNRLHDPQDFAGQSVLVVGGGDSAAEAAIALAACGARVTLSYRRPELTRPKQENVEKLEQLAADPNADVQVARPTSPRVTAAFTSEMATVGGTGSLRLALATQVQEVRADTVCLTHQDGRDETLEAEAVFSMIGREAPLDFFRRSGVPIHGEWRRLQIAACLMFVSLCAAIYHWKSYSWFPAQSMDPSGWTAWLTEQLGAAATDRTTLLHTVLRSASGPSFYYTLLYSSLVVAFGFRRIRRRRTPYVRLQTSTLMVIQCLPLFILPELVLPWMGRNEWFVEGAVLRPLADLFFEPYDGGLGIERAYWRSYGFVLAWPLMVYNWFTHQPMWGWLVVGSLQTFVLIPLMIRRWGKGAYCGWICSCGALAETLGDTHRHKMPHGPRWNRLNLVGQGILVVATLMLLLRVVGWIAPGSWPAEAFSGLLDAKSPWTYKWAVDVFLGGIVGVGLYFWFSGRVWCRFACPLAALMNIYGRFSRFRIFSDKKKCISCNVCTSVCHQGIDVMAFANKGAPMEDPQCVRCSACVQGCPTGVLSFGRVGHDGLPILDRLPASNVRQAEGA